MTNRTRLCRRALGDVLASLVLCGGLLLVAAANARAADEEDKAEESGFTTGWLDLAGVTGKGVFRSGSKSKFLEDHNVQSGADVSLGILQQLPDGAHMGLRGFGQSGEQQGYVVGDYGSDVFDLSLDFQSWTEYYNVRTGERRPAGYPFSDNGRFFYGKGIPSTDWLTTGGDFQAGLGGPFHDLYGDFHYRDVNGDMTLLKSGSADNFQVPGSGPGSVDYSFPGRKKVDYDAYMGLLGTTSDLGNINWQTNAVYQYHDNQSKLTEPIYTTGALDEVDRYDENSDIHVVRYDLTGSRHLRSDLFVFGSGFFSYERSDPKPRMEVTQGSTVFQTRQTDSSKVNRYTPALTLGSAYYPTTSLVVSADTDVRGHIQNADLDESRDESAFLTGDFGTASNHVDRYTVVSTTRLRADWKATRRLSVVGQARYQYRWEDVDSRQDTAFVVLEPSELEKYQSDQHRVKAGASARYRFNRGRSVEAGYELFYTNVSQNVDRLQNQLIMGDWDSLKHRAFLKASGRLAKSLRGELRGQYVYELRHVDEPRVQPVVVPNASSDKVDSQYWTVSPVLYYTPNSTWSLHGNYRIGLVKIKPKSGTAFGYKTLTQSLTAGASYRASEHWSASAAYTMYVNDDDVDNIGHDASVSGRYQVNDRWSINGGYRYLGYDLHNIGQNDYDAHVVSLGVTGHF